MEPDQTSRPSIVGYLVVLLGVAGWVASCFLPLYRVPDLNDFGITLYRQVSYGSAGAKLGGLLYLFGGIVALGVFSVLGVRRTLPWTRAVLAGAVVAWSLTSIGVLISLGDIGRVNAGWSFAVGYWCLWASVVCVVAGSVMVLSANHEGATTGGAPQEQVSQQIS